MSGNLSSIGFEFADDADYVAAVERLAESAERRLPCSAGDYAVWQADCGAALWFHLSAANAAGERDIIGLTPFFEGSSSLNVEISRAFQRPADNTFEGAWEGWIEPGNDGARGLPVVVEAVDFAARQRLDWPVRAKLRLCGFAREINAYPVPDGVDIDTGKRTPVAREGVYPVGHLAAADAKEGAAIDPSSFALILGRVVETHMLVNGDTGHPFHWLVVASQGCNFDVVAEPDAVNGEIVENGMVEVACQLFGRWI